jgi:signal transduction histidine kinase
MEIEMTKSQVTTYSSKKKTLTSYVEIKNIINQILFGEDLKDILEVVAIHLERKLPKTRAAILLFDEKKNCLFNGAAPSLPEEYSQKIDGLMIGPNAGSCGAAAFYKSTIVVRDTHSDPLWNSHLETAKKYKLRACWSTPILNMKGELFGTFALYYSATHKPTQKEVILVKELCDLVCLAMERDRSAALEKQIQEEIKNQRAYALSSQKLASLGEMAKNIAHEINNPLAIITGSLHQMNRIIEQSIDSHVTNELKLPAVRMNRAVLRIEKIVNGLSSITREASNDKFAKVNAQAVIDTAFLIFQERFSTSEIDFKITGELEAVFECRSTQISQVLVNILNNSFEAISMTANPWIRIHVASYENKIQLEITDSGNGIPFSQVDKIMIPLFTTKANSRAAGLGLSVSQTLVEENYGKIWYDKSCQNTRFVIELPKEQISILKQAA